MKRHCQSSGDSSGTPIVKKPSSDNVVDVVDKILQALSELVEKIENILTTAKEYVDDSVEAFVEKKVGVLASAIGLYCKCYRSVNVTTKEDFEKLISTHYRRLSVQYAFEDLMDVERRWLTFLQAVDRSSVSSLTDAVLDVGATGPVDTPLVDVRTDTAVTLRHYSGDCRASPLLVVLLRHFA